MCAFHHPSSHLELRMLLPLRFLLPTRLNLRSVVAVLKKSANFLRLISDVETRLLMSPGSRLRAVNGRPTESRLQKLGIVGVGATHFHSQLNAASACGNRPLGTQLSTIHRISSGTPPHPETILASLRQRFTNSTECLSVSHAPAGKLCAICIKCLLRSIFGSNDARRFLSRTRVRLLSIKRLFWGPISHVWRRLSSPLATAHLLDFSDSEAAWAAFVANKLAQEPPNVNIFSLLCHRKHLRAGR
ncbi:hypothetical protein HG15A2_23560 [Adhaeretor mobilis]|uniref:Uncharacterized protein n=1 Tax=Adhaeretor mobilis TaxID=1930276 RepID=A0A517MW13_9BACT|nr:hypothetical protein HG15A2_23560 [Adhaeretor mobilis]